DVGCAIGRQAARQIVGAGDRFRSRHARSLALYPWTVEPGAKPDNATSFRQERTRDAAELCLLPSCAARLASGDNRCEHGTVLCERVQGIAAPQGGCAACMSAAGMGGAR